MFCLVGCTEEDLSEGNVTKKETLIGLEDTVNMKHALGHTVMKH